AQGRVKPTLQLKGGVPVNDDAGLEREADVMGARAMSGLNATPLEAEMPVLHPATSSAEGTVQRLKSHAEAYIRVHGLAITSSQLTAVRAYVMDKGNPTEHRKKLLKAWNKNQRILLNQIPTPDDLVQSGAFQPDADIENWNSGDDDDVDMDKAKEDRKVNTHDLVRADESLNKTGVTEYNYIDAIRMGRQMVKRDQYGRLPMITAIGGFKFELNHPGTKDIYATPLNLLAPTTDKPNSRYQRAGTSSDFNWINLATNLRKRRPEEAFNHQKQMMGFFLTKEGVGKMDEETAEALAAMACDLMKGSGGGRSFMKQALEKLKQTGQAVPFEKLFAGPDPIYQPAKKGGRALVTQTNEQIQIDANLLLGVNN
ncbi:MAG: hypothetical protein B7Z23_12760, partial [Pseudomonadales bacterium 32-61-5]